MTNGVICKLGCEKISTLLFEFIYSGHSSGLGNRFKESSPYFHEHTVLLFSFFYLSCCIFLKKNWQSERIRAVNLIVVGDRMQIILYAPRETIHSEKIQVNFFIIICITRWDGLLSPFLKRNSDDEILIISNPDSLRVKRRQVRRSQVRNILEHLKVRFIDVK